MDIQSVAKVVVVFRNEANPPASRWVVSVDTEDGQSSDVVGGFSESEQATEFATKYADRRNLQLVLCD